MSPNFSLFIIFFSYYYLKRTNIKTVILILLFCILSSLPAFYYIFVLDINFLDEGTIVKFLGRIKELAKGLFKFFCTNIEPQRRRKIWKRSLITDRPGMNIF